MFALSDFNTSGIMRSEVIPFSHLSLIFFFVVTFNRVKSLVSIERRYHYFTREVDRHDQSRLSSSRPSSASQEEIIRDHPWYSHPNIGRDRSHVQNCYNEISHILKRYREEHQGKQNRDDEDDTDKIQADDIIHSSKFALISSEGMWHQKSCSSAVLPMYLTISQLEKILRDVGAKAEISELYDDSPEYVSLVAWIGTYDSVNYWVVDLNGDKIKNMSEAIDIKALLEPILLDSCTSEVEDDKLLLDCKPLREFGDLLQTSHDAGILATANGLVEFHKSHKYCSLCGSSTHATKAGASRTCTNGECQRSIYPRIDSATIMLVTSPCNTYALLGRKKSWPIGRYSTLAGFCEVGETLEECCQRETYEESGVVINPQSIQFIASQPWPFPRSLMVGFRATATAMSGSSGTAGLPEIIIDTNEMEDIRWFAKDFVRKGLEHNGSTALTFQPSEEEAIFHVPGKASLARYLIKGWVDE